MWFNSLKVIRLLTPTLTDTTMVGQIKKDKGALNDVNVIKI